MARAVAELTIESMTDMATPNSRFDVYIDVLGGIYHDLVGAIVPQNEVERDLREISNRTHCEGIGFLTKTLPLLGKSIDRSLAHNTPLSFSLFKRRKGSKLPAFGWRLFRVLFDNEGFPRQAKPSEITRRETIDAPGWELSDRKAGLHCREARAMVLRALRQICYVCYKLNIPYHEEQEAKVVETFIKTDKALPRIRLASLTDPRQRSVLHLARRLICRVLCNADPMSGIPRHGPGAVSTGEKSPEKHTFRRFYRRLDRVFKYDHWFYLNASHLSDHFEDLQQLEEHRAGVAKVVLVPKDSRGPRLISCEPLEYQWIQQALMSVLVTHIERHPLTRGHVNFTDQTINGRLALEGSTGSYPWVTLDMKEASDRVSLDLVYTLFPPNWFEALYASRSSHTRLPDGTIFRLKKFAPMGSAVCFPVEALVFWAICVSSLMIHKNYTLRKACTRVFVYGDDIVLGTDDHSVVYPHLEGVGLLTNPDKCCVAGPFKESCGVDAYEGIPVTPLRLRDPWRSAPKSSMLASWAAFSNAAYAAGMVVTAKITEEYLQRVYRRRIPVVSHRNPSVICFIRPDQHVPPRLQPHVRYRYNRRLHKGEYQGIALRPTSFKTKVFGYPLLLRYLAEKERDKPTQDEGLRVMPRVDQTGYFAIAHREKPTRAWTAA